MKARNVAIFGKRPAHKSPAAYKAEGFTTWTVGTNYEYEGDIDRYYELHGIETFHASGVIVTNGEQEAYALARRERLPVNNSVSVMLLEAFLSGADSIVIDGCPMDGDEEYIEQKPTLALCVGYVIGQGTRVTWTDGPADIAYGFSNISNNNMEETNNL